VIVCAPSLRQEKRRLKAPFFFVENAAEPAFPGRIALPP
jgi:hypothetical protein